MTISMVVFTGMSWNVPQSKRLYHILTTFIVTFAALSYFAMASGHGIGYHHTTEEQHHKHVPSTQHDIYRQVYEAAEAWLLAALRREDEGAGEAAPYFHERFGGLR